MPNTFQFELYEATEIQSKARIGLAGPAGSGKTWTGLLLATELAQGAPIIVIDSENRSSAKYAKDFLFKVLPLKAPYSPAQYVAAIKFAELQQPGVIFVDGISQAWAGEGGALEMADQAAARYQNNKFAGWRDVTPEHNKLVDSLVHCQTHLIISLRTKTEYILVDNGKGKTKPEKVGMAPIQREGMDYEMDIVLEMTIKHQALVSKTRMHSIDSKIYDPPTAELGKEILAWLSSGEIAPETIEEHTKDNLILFGQTLGLTPASIARELKKAELEFDPEQWDKMKTTLAASVAANP